jgi:hypothetical protein
MMVRRFGSLAARLTNVGIRTNVLAQRAGARNPNRAHRGGRPFGARLRLHRCPRRPRVADRLLRDRRGGRPWDERDARPQLVGAGNDHEWRRDRRSRALDTALGCSRLSGRRRRRNDGLSRGRRLCGHFRSGRPRRRRRYRRRRQEPQWIDVALWIAGRADPEVDVRLGGTLRAGRADDGALAHDSPALHADRAEMQQGCRVTERRLDRDRLAAGRHGAGKRHDAFRGSEHRLAGRRSDVDAPVLARRVGRVVIEDERSQDRAVDRPRPGPSCGHGQRESAHQHEGESPHRSLLCCQI